MTTPFERETVNLGAAVTQELLKPLAHFTSLAHLHLRLERNNIGDVGAQQLLKPLAHLNNLVHLHVDL